MDEGAPQSNAGHRLSVVFVNARARAPSDLLDRLGQARTVGQELEALVGGLSPRNACIFLDRICARSHSQPTLEEIAAKWGISRERVRQIVEGHKERLAGLRLRLPLASRLPELVEKEGGLLSTPELLELSRAHEIEVSSSELPALPFLSELDLIPSFTYVAEVDSWVTAGGERMWLRSGVLANDLARIKRVARASIETLSCIEESRLADFCLLTRWQRRCALSSEYGRPPCEIQGFLVPTPTIPSTLTRAVEKILAVSPELPLADVIEGVARLRSKLGEVPPISVLEHILDHHPWLVVTERQEVRVADGAPLDDWLSDAEKAFVHILDGAGGVAEYSQLLEAMETEGFSRHTAGVLMSRSPFLRRPRVGLYAPRRRSMPRTRLLEKKSNGERAG